VIIQTHLPDHSVIELAKAQDYIQFFEQELATRELFQYPPFTHLVKLTFSGKEANSVQREAEELRKELIASLPPTFEILPVVPCGHAKVKQEYRFQFLIKGKGMKQLLTLLQKKKLEERKSRLFIDVDPLSTFF